MKRIAMLVLVLICLSVTVGMILPVSAASSYIRGDGNGDGRIDAKDLIVLTKALLADSEYNDVLDCNGDGILDIRDLVRIKMHLAMGTPLGKQSESPQPIRDPYELPVV